MRKVPVLLLFFAFLVLAGAGLYSQPVAAAHNTSFPEIIPLPDGFRPEGIVIGRDTTIFAGSLANGAIYQADWNTATGDILVEGQDGEIAVGLSYDRRSDNLFVAGGVGGTAKVYDAGSGDLLAKYELSTAPTFVNDVIVTRRAAYFTNSFQPVMYRLPLGPHGSLPDAADVEEIPLGGEFDFDPAGFNANGIEATPNGRHLIVVNSTFGALYRVDPDTGHALRIDLGGDAVPNGDGLLLNGRTLYVVQNFLNQIAVIRLNPDFTAGNLVDTITDDDFRIPTTMDSFGSRFFVVNARFDVAPTPDTEYEIVRIRP